MTTTMMMMMSIWRKEEDSRFWKRYTMMMMAMTMSMVVVVVKKENRQMIDRQTDRQTDISIQNYNLFSFFFFFGFLPFSWAAPEAYGGSQARGRIGAIATSLRQSHSNTGSELHLQPTPQLTATPDP